MWHAFRYLSDGSPGRPEILEPVKDTDFRAWRQRVSEDRVIGRNWTKVYESDDIYIAGSRTSGRMYPSPAPVEFIIWIREKEA